MKHIREFFPAFTAADRGLWLASIALILLSFRMFDGAGYLTLAASLTGATSLLFNAKGHPLGQLLMLIFSVLYGVISLSFSYYGEMITYLGMTAPMALMALVSWLRNPAPGKRAEVRVNRLGRPEILLLPLLTAAVTAGFGWLLAALGTKYLPLSTLSVATSFGAAYLTFRRSAWFAMAYAANDVILVLLWLLAAAENRAYVPVAVCFSAFFFNDLWGFACWLKMRRRQHEKSPLTTEGA